LSVAGSAALSQTQVSAVLKKSCMIAFTSLPQYASSSYSDILHSERFEQDLGRIFHSRILIVDIYVDIYSDDEENGAAGTTMSDCGSDTRLP
jgi:hypothetical protein